MAHSPDKLALPLVFSTVMAIVVGGKAHDSSSTSQAVATATEPTVIPDAIADGQPPPKPQPIRKATDGDFTGKSRRTEALAMVAERHTEYSIVLVEPDARVDYKILEIKPDKNDRYSIIVLKPAANEVKKQQPDYFIAKEKE